MKRYLVLLLGLALVLAAPVAYAQQTTAALNGVVSDESEAVLPGVTVTATEVNTGAQYFAVTDAVGNYNLPSLAPGTYNLTAELPGFATVLVPNIELLLGQTAALPFTLTVAALEETVTVTSEAPLVDLQSTQVTGSIDRRQMEELPIFGRDWLGLTLMVKGITGNDVTDGRPAVYRDGEFQVNIDGQQQTQAVSWTSAFGQPKLSREAIAEFQVVTNLFDVTQGRATAIQVHAITRSGTNRVDGSSYGYFRHDSMNAADNVADEVLPYSVQQVGGSIGGPIVRDKVHYFVTYEYERQPFDVPVTPAFYVNSGSVNIAAKSSEHRIMGRGDWQIGPNDHFMVRYNSNRQFDPQGGWAGGSYTTSLNHPTQTSDLGRDSYGITANWTRTLSSTMVQEVKASFFHYHWNHTPAEGVPLFPRFRFHGIGYGGPGARSNYPEEFWQNTPAIRYELSWTKGDHDIKIGGEHLHWVDDGWWLLRTRGQYSFNAVPVDYEERFPLQTWDDLSTYNAEGANLDALATNFTRFFARAGGQTVGNCPVTGPGGEEGCGNWTLKIPRPTWAAWIGDTWRPTNQLTLNLGVRYDLDWGAMAPPFVNETDINIDTGLDQLNVGYRNDIRDTANVSPRLGFNYDVTGTGDFTLRGGTGLYYMAPVSELAFVHQMFNGQRVITNSFDNDGLPGFVQLDPTDHSRMCGTVVCGPQRGLSEDVILDAADAGQLLQPQNVFVIDHGYRLPYSWQSTVGFQKQVGDLSAIDVDLTYFRGRDMGQNRDPNLFYDPVTGVNKHPTALGPDGNQLFGRPRTDYGRIILYTSEGRGNGLQLATGFRRRFRDNFQYQINYTVMFYRNDTGTYGGGYGGSRNNNFDLSGDEEWARAVDFQRHTIRGNLIYRLPYDFTVAAAYLHGSGNPYRTSVAANPFGTAAVNRYRAAAANATSPAQVALATIPRNDATGDYLSKVDLRLSKAFQLGGDTRVTGYFEVFNLLNHDNFGSYIGSISAPNFGDPAQNFGNTYLPRVLQLGVAFNF
jgi:hypothetical protein